MNFEAKGKDLPELSGVKLPSGQPGRRTTVEESCGKTMPNRWVIARSRSVFLSGVFLFVLVVLGLGLLVFLKKPAVQMEVLSAELVRRDGLLYHRDQAEPFTGVMVEKYGNGSSKARSMIRGGVLDGLSEGWHTNGQIQVRELFRKGISHGLREKWYENGSRMSEGMIVEGKHDGLFRRWHENGALAEEVNMRQGEPDGLSQAFYPSGFLKARAILQAGKVIENNSWDDGQQKETSRLANSQ